MHKMDSDIKKFLYGKLDYSNLDVILDEIPRTFDNVDIIICDLTTTIEEYITKIIECSNNTKILYFRDHYVYKNLSFNDKFSIKESQSINDIVTVIEKFKHINFVLLTVNIQTNDEILFKSNIYPDNLSVVISPYWLYEHLGFDKNIHKTKSLKDKTHVLTLNNNPRPHRSGLVAYLEVLGIAHKNVKTTFMSSERWDENVEFEIDTILSYSYENEYIAKKIRKVPLTSIYKNTSEEVYANGNTNYYNFTHKLYPYYDNAVVEIVTETTSIECSAVLTEKIVHCMYGRCIPIIIGTKNNVEIYRDMGYDMFDDIIDHSYDYEPNPYYRMRKAIDDNIRILTDRQFAIDMYDKCGDRFEYNINNYIKNYDIILANTIGELDARIP